MADTFLMYRNSIISGCEEVDDFYNYKIISLISRYFLLSKFRKLKPLSRSARTLSIILTFDGKKKKRKARLLPVSITFPVRATRACFHRVQIRSNYPGINGENTCLCSCPSRRLRVLLLPRSSHSAFSSSDLEFCIKRNKDQLSCSAGRARFIKAK